MAQGTVSVAGLFVGNRSLLGNLSCCQVLPGASAANELPMRENGTSNEPSPGWEDIGLALPLLLP